MYLCYLYFYYVLEYKKGNINTCVSEGQAETRDMEIPKWERASS